MEFIARTVGGVTVGEPVSFGGLTMWPLEGEESAPARYFTLDEALAQRWAMVTELTAEGVVPEVRVVNDSPYELLVVDGEELSGANQDRVANVSAFVPHQSACGLPVSGVEPGRWSFRSPRLETTPYLHYASGRRECLRQVSASLREIGKWRAYQADVWDDLSDRLGQSGVGSPTGAMSDLFLRHEGVLEAYVRAILPRPGQRGAFFMVENGPAGLDLFDRTRTLERLLPKLVRSYALEALGGHQCQPARDGGCDRVERLLDVIAAAPTEAYRSVGLGHDLRFAAAGVAGAALVAEGRVVHLAAFVTQ